MGKRVTNLEKQERIEVTAQLIMKNYPSSKVTQALMKQYCISERHAERYKKEARDYIKSFSNEEVELLQARLHFHLLEVMQGAQESGQYNAAINALKLMSNETEKRQKQEVNKLSQHDEKVVELQKAMFSIIETIDEEIDKSSEEDSSECQ